MCWKARLALAEITLASSGSVAARPLLDGIEKDATEKAICFMHVKLRNFESIGKEFQLECLALQDADSACGSYVNWLAMPKKMPCSTTPTVLCNSAALDCNEVLAANAQSTMWWPPSVR